MLLEELWRSLVWTLGLMLLISFIARLCTREENLPEFRAIRERINRIVAIINYEAFNATHVVDLPKRLALRARPNERLCHLFDIDNSFTTFSPKRHREFSGRAQTLVNRTDEWHWFNCREAAFEALQLSAGGDARLVSAQQVVSTMCFCVVLERLFPHYDKTALDLETATECTAAINKLWIMSKKKSRHPAASDDVTSDDVASDDVASDDVAFHECAKLRNNLRRLRLVSSSAQREDPLGIILPTYETLWRVVLFTYIHLLSFRLDQDTRQYVQILVSDLVKRPRPLFGEQTTRFAKEALRLYPPTKRIYRGTEKELFIADIEDLQHDQDIWGLDALHFKPSRFKKLSQHQSSAYLPFGTGPHRCPAARGFGYNMVALLVAVLLDRLGTAEKGAQVVFGDPNLDFVSDRERQPLPTGREDMAQWRIWIGGFPCAMDWPDESSSDDTESS